MPHHLPMYSETLNIVRRRMQVVSREVDDRCGTWNVLFDSSHCTDPTETSQILVAWRQDKSDSMKLSSIVATSMATSLGKRR